MKHKFCVVVTILIIALIYAFACNRAGAFLVKKDEPVHADALVILMGSLADRVLQTVDLYKRGLADKIIIVDGGIGSLIALKERGADILNFSEQLRNTVASLGIPADSIIILKGDTESTQKEALIIKDYIANKPAIDTLILVSSATHTRRASMVFKTAFKNSEKPVYVYCSPSSYTVFNAEKWWKSKDDIETVLLEYLKLTHFVLFDRNKLKQEIADHNQCR